MNASINSDKHPYMREDAWRVGLFNRDGRRLSFPLSETFLKRDLECLGSSESPANRIIRMMDTLRGAVWQQRPENFREVNGYPKK